VDRAQAVHQTGPAEWTLDTAVPPVVHDPANAKAMAAELQTMSEAADPDKG
jgi:hypothetical protein